MGLYAQVGPTQLTDKIAAL